MVCSMKASSINSLTSPCVECFNLHVIIPAQIGSSLSIEWCVKCPL